MRGIESISFSLCLSRSEREREGVRMDLDSYLQSEMEDLNDMFNEFETEDQRKKRRARQEEEKIMTKV